MLDESDLIYIAPWVELAPAVIVHPFVYLGKMPSHSFALARRQAEDIHSLTIGDRTEIGPYTVIYGGVAIGIDCLIGDGVNIREGTKIGNRCVIGTHVSINYNAVIEDEVRIMNGTHITGGCHIGQGTFIGCNVSTMNDRRKEVVDYQFVGAQPPIIGKRCLIGSGACILPGVKIGDGAIVAAGAIVVHDVPPGGIVKAIGAV